MHFLLVIGGASPETSENTSNIITKPFWKVKDTHGVRGYGLGHTFNKKDSIFKSIPVISFPPSERGRQSKIAPKVFN